MSWNTSSRRDRLPADWTSIRRKVLRRDQHLCQWPLPDGSLCFSVATEVDHIKAGDDHSLANLQALCTMHHRRKSSGEGASARNARRREINNRFRRDEGHPGLM